MEIIQQRIAHGNDSSVAEVKINNVFQCYVLEDQPQKVAKVYGETRIPAGRYELKLRTDGNMHHRYAKRYPDMHVGMIEITGIKNFSRVYYHIGNNDDETLGCPLTGTKYAVKNGEYFIPGGASSPAYVAFYKKVAPLLAEGKRVFVTILDEK